MSFCSLLIAVLCFISVICVAFSMSEKRFSQFMEGRPGWEVCAGSMGCWKSGV